jgi:hypothetical protein
MNAKQFLTVTLGSALLFSPALLEARPSQEQAQESVADAARKAQAAKKTAPKAKRVIDNDNLDTIKGSISIVGQQPAPPVVQTKATAAADDKTKAAAPPDDKKPPVQDEAYWRKTFGDANNKLAGDARELDVLQREYNLKQQQYYSDPNTAMKEQYNRQELTDTKKNIDDKAAAVAQDKQDISDLEDSLRKAGGEPGWASPPPTAQP